MDYNTTALVAGAMSILVILWAVYRLSSCSNASHATGTGAYEGLSNRRISKMTAEDFLSEDVRNKKPFRFTKTQISKFTHGYSTQLGAGRFATVFKGELPNGLAVAVKVFRRDLDIDQGQFTAAVCTVWRTRHVNLVKLFGFCVDDNVRALVYERVDNGTLDAYLLADGGRDVGVPTLRDIAVGVARGIRHLHKECKEKKKVVHYDIKLSNVLLDGALTPKVTDVGLTRLVNADTHVVILSTLPAATRGYVAPEIRVQPDITEKCDVYSFGMLLLEIVGRKRIPDEAAALEGGEQWFPELAWTKYESGDLMDLAVMPSRDHTVLAIDRGGASYGVRVGPGLPHALRQQQAAAVGRRQHGEFIEHFWRKCRAAARHLPPPLAIDDDAQQCTELVERMCKVAFWCVQQQPEARPSMGDVVKMLKGEMDIAPPANPFQDVPVVTYVRTKVTSGRNTAAADDVSNGGDGIIDSLFNVVQTVIQSDDS